MRKLKGSTLILISMGFALVFGLAVNIITSCYGFKQEYLAFEKFVITPIGDVFLKLLLVAIVPIVFLAIAGGIMELGQDKDKLKRVSIKAVIYYFLTTLFAVVIGVVLAYLIKPGVAGHSSTHLVLKHTMKPVSMIDTLVGMFPKNIFASLSEGNMLQIMIFAIFFGIAIIIMGGKESNRIRELVHYFTSVMIEMIKIIMKFAPIGVFCLLVKAIATQGYSTIIGLALYVITILIGLALQFILVYAPILIFMVKMNPFTFIKNIGEVAAIAFATSSSKAALPISMEVTEKKFGVNGDMVRFLIPLGASINMNGAAIMQGVGIIFISQIYHVDLSLPVLCTIVFTAIFTSAGAAGVPSGATIMLTSILLMVGIPAEGIALIMGVDRIVDMCRTVVNISGDIVCAVAVANSEGAILSHVGGKQSADYSMP